MSIALVAGAEVEGEKYYTNSNKAVLVLPSYNAMAGSGMAIARDGTPMSNPANLALDSTSELFVSYAGYFTNAFSASLVSHVMPLDGSSGIGASIAYLHVPDIEDTRSLEEEIVAGDSVPWPIYDRGRVDYSSTSEIMVNVAYGRALRLTPTVLVAVGGALHGQRRRLLEVVGYGIGLDLGATLLLERAGFRVSLLADDLTTNYMYWTSDYKEHGAPHLRVGLGWRREIPYLYGRISLAYRTPDLLRNEGVYGVKLSGADREPVPYDESFAESNGALFFLGNYGLEYGIRNVLLLRVGYDLGQRRAAFGGGLNLFSEAFGLDFSYLPSTLGGTYQVGLSWHW